MPIPRDGQGQRAKERGKSRHGLAQAVEILQFLDGDAVVQGRAGGKTADRILDRLHGLHQVAELDADPIQNPRHFCRSGFRSLGRQRSRNRLTPGTHIHLKKARPHRSWREWPAEPPLGQSPVHRHSPSAEWVAGINPAMTKWMGFRGSPPARSSAWGAYGNAPWHGLCLSPHRDG